VLDHDEPPVLLGEDQGANAGEYALAALNDCLTTTLIYHAAAQGVKIDEVESTLASDVDIQGLLGISENVRNGYDKIKVTFEVKQCYRIFFGFGEILSPHVKGFGCFAIYLFL